MFGRKTLSMLTVLGILAAATASQAAIVMDASTNNGSFDGAANGPWSDSGIIPTGWDGTPLTGSLGYTVAQTAMHYYTFEAFNNTGVTVAENTVYTVNANVNAYVGETVNVAVIATENSDGTGTSVVLATASFSGGTESASNYTTSPTLFAATPGVSLPTNASIDGYYIQVRTFVNIDVGGYYWVDDIVVTSALVPEPASLGLMASSVLLVFSRRRKNG